MRYLRREAAAILVSAAATMLGSVAGCDKGNAYVPPPPAKVTVSVPVRRSVTNYLEYSGTTKAEETVELRARVKGFLKERNFDEKTPVKAGQLLFVIEEDSFRVALEMTQARQAEAEAALKKAEQSKAKEVAGAQLALDQASLVLARLEEARNRNLMARGAGTREALDQSEASRRKAEAQVQADEANLEQVAADYQTNILSAKANVEAAKSDVRNAEINLGYCRITAPFDGRISRRLFDVGNLVGDGQASVLATLYKIDPIYAYVNCSETDLLRFRRLSRETKRKNFEKGDQIALELGLADEVGFPHKGMLDYSDPAVDPATGTVSSRGVFPNPGPDFVILPGLFVRIRVALEERPDALLVPEVALGADQEGNFLLIVGKDNVVEKRKVRTGAQEGDLRIIEANLKPDDLVVVNGLQKARPGSRVVPERSPSAAPAVAVGPSHPE